MLEDCFQCIPKCATELRKDKLGTATMEQLDSKVMAACPVGSTVERHLNIDVLNVCLDSIRRQVLDADNMVLSARAPEHWSSPVVCLLYKKR